MLPVYGVSALPDDSGETPPLVPALVQSAMPGQTGCCRYMLFNTGNDNDSCTLAPLLDAVNTTMPVGICDINIYHDLNGNGVLNGGEPRISADGGVLRLILSRRAPFVLESGAGGRIEYRVRIR